ncbi:hypothetical protein DICVIV_07356 [Dictyocaulus viviparus]|uniref:Macoilin n=1 Tax=Dictyocaulus viviparus TaxID=29172 RepID=A0A0D8XPJ6_DICVI|nr:hypothetical protein DICVIV_07356 [Dictyocaulus viviparus]
MFLWIGVISLDILCGFRFELLYPFWLILRNGYEAVNKNHNAVVTLANHNTAKFSVLFVCVTATSDLICYLFIPVKFLVFLASTYVWVHVIWHSHGGFLRTLSAMIHEKQCFSALIFWIFIVAFEIGIRLKCYHLEIVGPDVPFLHYFCPNCLQTQGLAPVIPRSLNSFFGAHCIGYPLVIISFSLRYYFKEWRIRRRQDDVCRRNELLARMLTEALPAVYEGPKDYSVKSTLLDDENDLLELTNGTGQGMLLPPPTASNGTVHQVHSTKRTSGKVVPLGGRQRGSGRTKAVAAITSAHSQHSTSLVKSSVSASSTSALAEKRREREEDEGSEASFDRSSKFFRFQIMYRKIDLLYYCLVRVEITQSLCWHDSDMKSSPGGLSIVRLAWEAFMWLTAVAWPSICDDVQDDSSYGGDDDEEDSILEESGKKMSRSSNADENKHLRTSVTTTTTCSTGSRKSGSRSTKESAKTREKVAVVNVMEREKSNGIAVLNSKATNGTAYEVIRDPNILKESVQEPNSVSSVEVEKLRAELLQLKTAEADIRIQLSVSQNNEKHAKQEAVQLRSRLEQMEASMDSVEQQREKERQLEQEVDRLRSEAVSREERMADVESELNALRKYKEMNDVEVIRFSWIVL